ncbi:transposable element Tcb1 transposase [Trichonephila clavipes]|nr:transposable element Tcb1 transposase [Trichonephila clavipes]
MSRRKQRSAFDQISEFDRGRIGAYRDCGLSFREIGSRVGRNQATVMRICDRWMQEGMTDRRGRSHLPQCTTSCSSSEEFVAVDDDNVCISPIRADKDILKFVQSSKNIIDADSDNENEMNNVTPDPTSSETRNIMKNMRSYLDA